MYFLRIAVYQRLATLYVAIRQLFPLGDFEHAANLNERNYTKKKKKNDNVC